MGTTGAPGKNWVLWDEIARIPLIVWHPEWGHGTRPKQFVQPIDYFPTVLDAMDLDVPKGARLHGQSLMPYLRDERAPGRDAILYGQFAGTCNIADGEYALLQGVDESNPPVYAYSSIIANRNQFDWDADVLRCKLTPVRHPEKHKTRLYHAPSDPKQERDLADREPETLSRPAAVDGRKIARDSRAIRIVDPLGASQRGDCETEYLDRNRR